MPEATPKAPAAPKIIRSLGFLRPADSRAPATEPMAMMEFISPKALASRPNSVPTMAAMNRTKFRPRVPTMKTATSTTTMSGRNRT